MSNTANETKRPTHAVFQVIGEGEKPYWNRVGSAWQNKDNKGLNLIFDSFPLSGRVVVREITETDESSASQD